MVVAVVLVPVPVEGEAVAVAEAVEVQEVAAGSGGRMRRRGACLDIAEAVPWGIARMEQAMIGIAEEHMPERGHEHGVKDGIAAGAGIADASEGSGSCQDPSVAYEEGVMVD